MEIVELKLKQDSAVLGVDPKDLQNLVQFKVLHPQRRDSFYWFDKRLLLEAKVAFYLKECLGTSTDMLARFILALSGDLKKSAKLRNVWLRSSPAKGGEPIEVGIPLRRLAEELEEQLPLAVAHRDLPRGRKRPGWKREMRCCVEAAGRDLAGVPESRITEAIRGYRGRSAPLPEITVGPSRRSA